MYVYLQSLVGTSLMLLLLCNDGHKEDNNNAALSIYDMH